MAKKRLQSNANAATAFRFMKRVFALAFDTHSSVHAYWAANRIARNVSDQQGIALTSEAALEPAKVALEVARFVTYPRSGVVTNCARGSRVRSTSRPLRS